ncbi:hypothetical protein A2U01_0061948 [Trifolium medium]|uniref:Uncharacterized protein n=1 Tax=Trifolium medium TaxID=97028 RepID=A0A392RYM0_9FABA|nr:hypothetical protein [Trifolium medium]
MSSTMVEYATTGIEPKQIRKDEAASDSKSAIDLAKHPNAHEVEDLLTKSLKTSSTFEELRK